jgi:hypothetical protein
VKRKGAGFEPHGETKGLFVYPTHPRAKALLAAPFPSPELKGRSTMQSVVDVNRLPFDGEGGLVEVLRGIVDPRKARGIRHPLESVLALAVMACLSGMRHYESIAEWASDVPKDVLKRLRCWCHRAPSEATFRRVLSSVDASEVDKKVNAWLEEQEKVGALALDGKTLRGSGHGGEDAWHLLSAVTHERAVVVAQESVDTKTNEIKVAKPLLKDVDIEGATVTADAMHTQRDFARHLVEEKGADYVFIAKENQPTLRDDIKAVDWGSFFPSSELPRQGTRTDRDPPDLAE